MVNAASQTRLISNASTMRSPDQKKVVRLWGVAIVLAAFVIIIAELRYFIASGTPEATGSVYGNLGKLILIGLPWVAIVAGTLQAVSGLTFNQHVAAFSAQSLARRIALSVGVVIFSLAITTLAAVIA